MHCTYNYMYVLSSRTYLIMNDGQQRSDYYYKNDLSPSPIFCQILQANKHSKGSFQNPVGNTVTAKTSLPLRKEVTTSKLVSSFCDSLCNFLHFAQGSSAQLHTHLAKWVLTNHLQYCNLIGLHSSVQQYKSYISVSPGHPLGTGAGLRPATTCIHFIHRLKFKK